MNQLIYGGINTADYQIGISGGGTYAAPERDVTRYEVPGRNGELIVDNGRYKNIEVTYPAYIARKFKDRITDFRSALMAKRGYQRIEDTYHPDEYRMGTFVGAFDPETVGALNNSARFDLRFNCKPQRFLKSGEQPMQFLPPVYSVSYYKTCFIPYVEGQTITLEVSCPAEDELTLTVKYYNQSDQYNPRETQIQTAGNGDTITFVQPAIASNNMFWQLVVTGYSDAKQLKFRVRTATVYDDKPIEIDAVMALDFDFRNPTGYETRPLIECYSASVPRTYLDNYEGETLTSYFSFSSFVTGATHIYLDTDLQYLYTANGANVTNQFNLTSAGSYAGEGYEFPFLGAEDISFRDTSYANAYLGWDDSSTPWTGIGLMQIYPRWWRL